MVAAAAQQRIHFTFSLHQPGSEDNSWTTFFAQAPRCQTKHAVSEHAETFIFGLFWGKLLRETVSHKQCQHFWGRTYYLTIILDILFVAGWPWSSPARTASRSFKRAASTSYSCAPCLADHHFGILFSLITF